LVLLDRSVAQTPVVYFKVLRGGCYFELLQFELVCAFILFNYEFLL